MQKGVRTLDQGCPYPPFGLSLGWFLFAFSPRIGRSNTKFLLGLIVSLSIKKSTTTNFVVVDSQFDSENYTTSDSEINSQLCRCRFLKSTAMMKSFRLYFSLILGVYISCIFYLIEEDFIS
jgi:hypothetical protein